MKTAQKKNKKIWQKTNIFFLRNFCDSSFLSWAVL